MRTNSDLRQRAERIGSLLDQIDDLKVELKAAYEIAKSDGFNPASLRKAIAIARLDDAKRAKHDDAQSDLLLYLDEIEGRQLREAAE